jgi:hypothetical protein
VTKLNKYRYFQSIRLLFHYYFTDLIDFPGLVQAAGIAPPVASDSKPESGKGSSGIQDV